jgi:hypothetical protein
MGLAPLWILMKKREHQLKQIFSCFSIKNIPFSKQLIAGVSAVNIFVCIKEDGLQGLGTGFFKSY